MEVNMAKSIRYLRQLLNQSSARNNLESLSSTNTNFRNFLGTRSLYNLHSYNHSPFPNVCSSSKLLNPNKLPRFLIFTKRFSNTSRILNSVEFQPKLQPEFQQLSKSVLMYINESMKNIPNLIAFKHSIIKYLHRTPLNALIPIIHECIDAEIVTRKNQNIILSAGQFSNDFRKEIANVILLKLLILEQLPRLAQPDHHFAKLEELSKNIVVEFIAALNSSNLNDYQSQLKRKIEQLLIDYQKDVVVNSVSTLFKAFKALDNEFIGHEKNSTIGYIEERQDVNHLLRTIIDSLEQQISDDIAQKFFLKFSKPEDRLNRLNRM